MWLEKKLPKIQAEPKTKVHWDYVIEEMTWLSDVSLFILFLIKILKEIST